MVLHYVPQPAEAIREMARVVKPGGVVVVVDFVRHQAEWMRDELGVLWLGFPADEIVRWLGDAGLADVRVEHFASPSPGRDLPGTFLASAHKPA
jgi:ArsR family transcriptional regulator